MVFKKFIYKVKDIKFKFRMARQRFSKGFSDEDCWAMDYWLCETLPKMILNLRDMKHGAPELPFEEYDKLAESWKYEYKKQYKEFCKKEDTTYEEDSIFEKWYVLLSRIAYCLQQANKDNDLPNEYKEEYFNQLFGDYKEDSKLSFKEWWNKHFTKIDGGYVLEQNKVDEELQKNYFKKEEENELYKEKMKDEAMDLLKKYFYNLWD